MGVKLEIAGIKYDVRDYSVTEEATPLSLDDTSQSTGTMSASITLPEIFSEARKLQVEQEVNPVLNPITTVDQIGYNASEYSVTATSNGVTVEKIAAGATRFTVGGPVPVGTFLYYRGSGRAEFTHTPLPPAGPDEIRTVGWTPLIEPGWRIVQGLGFVSNYPGVGPFSLRLENVGDWIEISRRGLRSDTLTGNSPKYTSPDRFLSLRWLNEENASPTLGHWTSRIPGSDLVSLLGTSLLKGAPYRLTDSSKGVTSGTISDVNFGPGGIAQVSGITGLNQLNSYNVMALPTNLSDYPGFSGTLGEAVRYYAHLSGVSYIWVDPAVENIPVSYPGWIGETWFHLKQMATVHECELSFVAGFPVFRPVRGRTTEPGRWLSRSYSVESPSLALSVEAYNQNTRDIRNEYVVHPDTGDNTVLSAAPGEQAEFVLDLSASVYRITETAAVFTREDGRPASWAEAGASVKINPKNSRQLIVTMSPPVRLLTERVYVGWIVRDVRVPGLYVRADGVALSPEKVTYRTVVPEQATGTEVGVTLDSPFITDSDVASRALRRAGHSHSATTFRLSGSVTNVNRRGDTGIPDFVTYQEAQNYLETRLGSGFTYDDLQEFSESLERGDTYADLQSLFSVNNSSDYRFQEFGNVAGSRIWDQETRRWYRIRSATITPFSIDNISADDDLLLGEFVEPWEQAGMTYQDVQDSLPVGGPNDSPFLEGSEKISYAQLQLMGVPVV